VKIAVIPGDGIGKEVIPVAIAELPPDAEIVELDVGAERYLGTGELLTPEDIATIRDSDALLFGAIGDPRVPDGVLERGVLLELRRILDVYVNLRPFPELDLVFVRENSEGLYAGVGDRTADSASEVSVNTRAAIERCSRYAFELAQQRKGRLTWVHKTNVLVNAGGLWRDVVASVASGYPDVEVAYEHADACAYHLALDHKRYDVILTENLFGDVLSDLAAALAGGLGLAASANLHPDPTTRPSRCIGLFEPVHGSAPDIAGKGTADPTAAIRAARMLTEALSQAPNPGQGVTVEPQRGTVTTV
jgi:3-isopropylmalate dehydrogenase